MIVNKQVRIKKISVILILALNMFSINYAICQDKKVTLSGKVVAYENSLTRITRLTDVQQEEIFFVKIEKVFKGNEIARYIKVKYNFISGASFLPENFFEEKKLWKFVLIRNKQCDQIDTLENSSFSVINLEKGGELSKNIPIPCYLLTKVILKKSK